ncbi:three-helix bundle dimerization domain-containing protein [Williamsia sp. DF01-3]|uniref:three-helix bundle dimerization domain-containing protein n=1 Tax=Williamsia sp. DF01-3 TaxID=2934157 RepID=UPI001FF430F1|nr:hypothetical protein [Williamsia sp. DF01-3]MCK0519299.1 hypothetical protein [Williamsia sp. DF01-3]
MNPEDQEQQQIEQIADKLADKHADVPTEAVAEVVEDAYRKFDGQPIRDFVPLLAERRAEEELGGNPVATPESLEESS